MLRWLILFLLLPSTALAIGKVEKGDYSIEATGAQRLTGAYLRFIDVGGYPLSADDGLAASVTRLILDGQLGAKLDYKVNIFADLSRMPAASINQAFSTVSSFSSPYRNKYLAWDFWERGTVGGQLGLDRLMIRTQLEPVNIAIGRMPINYSVTQLFTPMMSSHPFPPRQSTRPISPAWMRFK